ncbi:MAG: glycerophosphodiester phosphodiesterase [Clostridia bacterium]|nr:glycerophosphodiester phosphodiesterase [Clostridia bacterium]
MQQFVQKIGVDGIELDVHVVKDGGLVIIHDERLDRTTDGTGFVKDYTCEELKKFDASAQFKGQYGFCGIPPLREYFERVKDIPGFMTNIELKTGEFEYTGIEDKVISMIEEYSLQDRIILSSFNHYTIKRCKQRNPEITAGFLSGDWILNFGAYAKSYGVECCHPCLRSLTRETVDEMKSQGRIINTWTVNEYEDIKRLSDMGIDALIGNFPDRMLELSIDKR